MLSFGAHSTPGGRSLASAVGRLKCSPLQVVRSNPAEPLPKGARYTIADISVHVAHRRDLVEGNSRDRAEPTPTRHPNCRPQPCHDRRPGCGRRSRRLVRGLRQRSDVDPFRDLDGVIARNSVRAMPTIESPLLCAQRAASDLTGGQPSEPSGPGRLRSHQAQSSGMREKGSLCANSRAAQTGQCGLARAGRPRNTMSITS